MAQRDNKWFYDVSTGEVSQGPKSPWSDRMGPYDTREEAEHAMEIAAARNEEADAEEDAWEDEN